MYLCWRAYLSDTEIRIINVVNNTIMSDFAPTIFDILKGFLLLLRLLLKYILKSILLFWLQAIFLHTFVLITILHIKLALIDSFSFRIQTLQFTIQKQFCGITLQQTTSFKASLQVSRKILFSHYVWTYKLDHALISACPSLLFVHMIDTEKFSCIWPS